MGSECITGDKERDLSAAKDRGGGYTLGILKECVQRPPSLSSESERMVLCKWTANDQGQNLGDEQEKQTYETVIDLQKTESGISRKEIFGLLCDMDSKNKIKVFKHVPS